MPKEVKAAIDKNGNVGLEWSGFQGTQCLTESKRLHELLAARFGIKQGEELGFTAKPELLRADPQIEQTRAREAQQNG
ncbi:MAG TPA: hypothetical protein VFA15_01955 [Nitrososphaera sp.]|nr:hypothetical protein [Nitrososphaera sp.]